MLVSAYAFAGVPAKALKAAFASAELYASPDLLAEYRDTLAQLRSSGKLTADQSQALVAGIAALLVRARVVVPAKTIHICRDPGDNMLLECSRAAKADVLLTGDKDLLSLAGTIESVGLKRLRILKTRRYLRHVARRKTRAR